MMNRWRFAAFLAIGLAHPARAQVMSETNNKPVPSIDVTGSAEVRVVPDEVHLVLGIESQNKVLDTAKSENDKAVAATIKFLKESGVEAKDIQTDYINVRPEYGSGSFSTREKVFSVNRTLGVRIRKVADFEKLLTGALRSGANSVQGIDFRTTELRKHRDHARQMAIKAAKEKAEALAGELGAKVGKPLVIRETPASGWAFGGWNRSFGNASQNAVQSMAPAAVGNEESEGLAVGQISVNASIEVTFILEP
ncbi:MAG: SIMPL domain-containing protein [Isosphaeraceae bacterium]